MLQPVFEGDSVAEPPSQPNNDGSASSNSSSDVSAFAVKAPKKKAKLQHGIKNKIMPQLPQLPINDVGVDSNGDNDLGVDSNGDVGGNGGVVGDNVTVAGV
jgi:hypothetical protein